MFMLCKHLKFSNQSCVLPQHAQISTNYDKFYPRWKKRQATLFKFAITREISHRDTQITSPEPSFISSDVKRPQRYNNCSKGFKTKQGLFIHRKWAQGVIPGKTIKLNSAEISSILESFNGLNQEKEKFHGDMQIKRGGSKEDQSNKQAPSSDALDEEVKVVGDVNPKNDDKPASYQLVTQNAMNLL